MALMRITMDGVNYHVRISADTTMRRAFSFVEGGQGGIAQSGLEILDTIGTAYSYTVSVLRDPAYPADYDAFYYAVSCPNRTHTVTMPFGASTLTFGCRVDAGSDELTGRRTNDWNHLSVTFTPLRPQRMAEDEA